MNFELCDCISIKQTDKPWLTVPQQYYSACGCGRQWTAFSNHKFLRPGEENKLKNIQAFYLIQDGGYTGAYNRIIFWIDNKSYISCDDIDKFMFCIQVQDMKPDEVYADTRTGVFFKVIYSQEFIKVLERQP